MFPANGKKGKTIRCSHSNTLKIRLYEQHCIVIIGSNQQEVTTVNVYTSNVRAPGYLKQLLLDQKGKTDTTAIIMGDLNTPFSSMDRLLSIKHSMPEIQNTYFIHQFMKTR